MFKELFLEIYKFCYNDKPKVSDPLYITALKVVYELIDCID